MNQVSRKTFLRGAFVLALASTALVGCSQVDTAAENAPPRFAEPAPTSTVLYLVRHAEKELEGDDPELSAAGYERADELSRIFRDVPLTAVYSTDTRRTRDTAGPTAAQKSIELRIYDPRNLEEFAQSFSDIKGQYLIVGHSNTTPALADALGGEGGSPIVEESEYDRLYVLTIADGVVETDLQRFP